MNFIKLYSDRFDAQSIGNGLCKKNCDKGRCKSFLVSKYGTFSTGICPYGFSCVFEYDLVCCGVSIDGYFNEKKIKGHMQNFKDMKIIKVSKEEHEELKNFLYAYYSYTITSQTKHELANFVGYLKSILEICIPTTCIHSDAIAISLQMVDIYEIFENEVSNYYDFIRVELRNKNNIPMIFKDKLKLSLFYKLTNLYAKMINDIYKKALEFKRIVGRNSDYEKEYGVNKEFLSLIFLNDLFINRIEYQNYIFTTEDTLQEKKIIKYNWYKVATKYSKIMGYSAAKKKTRFIFKGSSHNDFEADSNLYMAIFIVFENAIKFTPYGELIHVYFIDSDEECEMIVENKCKRISTVDKDILCKRGYCGDNSSQLTSNGLGLFLVSQILKSNSISFDISAKDDNCLYSISIKAKKKTD